MTVRELLEAIIQNAPKLDAEVYFTTLHEDEITCSGFEIEEFDNLCSDDLPIRLRQTY